MKSDTVTIYKHRSYSIMPGNFEPCEEPMTVTVYKFYTANCQPCKAIQPHLDRLAQEYPQVDIVPVDANVSPLVEQFGVTSVPTLIFMRDGKEIDRLVGLQSYDRIKNELVWALA